MFEIKWQRLNAESDRFQYGKYTFKRRKLKDYTVYSIWEGDEMKYSSRIEYRFLAVAYEVVNDCVHFRWSVC